MTSVEISEFFIYATYILLLNVNHIDWCVWSKPHRNRSSAKSLSLSNLITLCSHENNDIAAAVIQTLYELVDQVRTIVT